MANLEHIVRYVGFWRLKFGSTGVQGPKMENPQKTAHRGAARRRARRSRPAGLQPSALIHGPGARNPRAAHVDQSSFDMWQAPIRMVHDRFMRREKPVVHDRPNSILIDLGIHFLSKFSAWDW